MSYSAAENGQKRSWKDHLGNWRVYAAAAGATLANASSAEANIIYTVAQPPIEANFRTPFRQRHQPGRVRGLQPHSRSVGKQLTSLCRAFAAGIG